MVRYRKKAVVVLEKVVQVPKHNLQAELAPKGEIKMA